MTREKKKNGVEFLNREKTGSKFRIKRFFAGTSFCTQRRKR